MDLKRINREDPAGSRANLEGLLGYYEYIFTWKRSNFEEPASSRANLQGKFVFCIYVHIWTSRGLTLRTWLARWLNLVGKLYIR